MFFIEIYSIKKTSVPWRLASGDVWLGQMNGNGSEINLHKMHKNDVKRMQMAAVIKSKICIIVAILKMDPVTKMNFLINLW